MKNFFKALIGILTILGLVSVVVNAGYSDDNDVYLYNEIVTIKGRVQLLNHPVYGKVPAGGQYLVFQREGCKRCLVATHADKDGNYQIMVGKGKYKIIVFNPAPPTFDLLAPDQPRFVTASILGETVFDINIKTREDKK